MKLHKISVSCVPIMVLIIVLYIINGMATPTPPQEASVAVDVIQTALDNNQELPAGTFIGNWELKDLKSVSIKGAGKTKTILLGLDPNKPTLSIKGMWYSKISDLCIGRKKASVAALEVDKGTFGVQGNTFQDILVDGQGLDDGLKSDYAMTMCRIGGSGAQGSEQLFINCHFSGAKKACYYQTGFNALNNTFLGGNFQNYLGNGIELVAGSCTIISVGFQCANSVQTGWDIACYQAGVQDSIIIMGCRTESTRFCKSAWSQPATIIGCSQSTGYKIIGNVIEMDRGRVLDSRFQGDVSITTNPDIKAIQVDKDTVLDKETKEVLVDASKGPVKITLNWWATNNHKVTVVKGDLSSNYVTVVSNRMNGTDNQCVLTKYSRIKEFMLLGGGTLPKLYYYKKDE